MLLRNKKYWSGLFLRGLLTLGMLSIVSIGVAATCSNFIQAIPVTISNPGYYCMDRNLSASQKSGYIIRVESDDVTIDMQGYTLDNGTDSGDAGTVAISSNERSTITIKNGRISGFAIGITHSGSTRNKDHVIQDVTLSNIRNSGISIEGRGHRISNVVIKNTGVGNAGSNTTKNLFAIYLGGAHHFLENVSISVIEDTGVNTSYGIYSLAGNVIFDRIDIATVGKKGSETGTKFGMYITQNANSIVRNSSIRGITAQAPGHADALFCENTGSAIVRDSSIVKYQRFGVANCTVGPNVTIFQ